MFILETIGKAFLWGFGLSLGVVVAHVFFELIGWGDDEPEPETGA